jgi:retron-type reverse transcriptase
LSKDKIGISATVWGGGCEIVRQRKLGHTFDDIISIENLCLAWEEFIVGKKKKTDVIRFGGNLMDNIITLHEDLANRTYRHGPYEAFKINDPKPRDIHKASVRDRLLHHAIYRVLYPFFDRIFIADSYSCRIDKGTHRAIKRFNRMAMSESRNNHRTCWVLKGDVRKFFASIDHGVLMEILGEYILDKNILWLLGEVVGSFFVSSRAPHFAGRDPSGAEGIPPLDPLGLGRNDNGESVGLPPGNLTPHCHPRENGDPVVGCLDSRLRGNDKKNGDEKTTPKRFAGSAFGLAQNDTRQRDCRVGLWPTRNDKMNAGGILKQVQDDQAGVGLPLGNLTSQLFANIYLNELDQWVKHNLRAKNYIRYADDFVVLSADREWLVNLIPRIAEFLEIRLKLRLHDKKVFIQTYASGVDFLGWINFPDHRVLRRTTKRRMFARINENPRNESLQSYLGMLKHGNTKKIKSELLQRYWLVRPS